jgi:hypothetical protein
MHEKHPSSMYGTFADEPTRPFSHSKLGVAATLLAQEEKVSRRVLPQRCPRPTPKRKARMLRVHVFLPAVFAC